MSTALYVVREDGEFESDIDGKALNDSVELLDGLAPQLGVTPLLSFFSASEDDLEVIEEAWFDPSEALETVRADWRRSSPGASSVWRKASKTT
jgi:hypothetical protein